MRHTLELAGLVACLTMSVPTVAVAGGSVLFTPPIGNLATGEVLQCSIMKVGKGTAAEIVVEVKDVNGVTLTQSTFSNVAEGDPVGTSAAKTGTPTPSYCRFVVPGSAKRYRGSALLLNPGAKFAVAAQ